MHFWIILAQVTIDPNSNLSLFIDTNLFLCKIKFPNFIKYLLIPLQHGHHAVQSIRIGDIPKIAQPSLGMVDIHHNGEDRWAKIPSFFRLIVISFHNMRVLLPPLERFQIVIVILLRGKEHLVLINQLLGVYVFQSDVVTQVCMAWLIVNFPFLHVEGSVWAILCQVVTASHQIIQFIQLLYVSSYPIHKIHLFIWVFAPGKCIGIFWGNGGYLLGVVVIKLGLRLFWEYMELSWNFIGEVMNFSNPTLFSLVVKTSAIWLVLWKQATILVKIEYSTCSNLPFIISHKLSQKKPIKKICFHMCICAWYNI